MSVVTRDSSPIAPVFRCGDLATAVESANAAAGARVRVLGIHAHFHYSGTAALVIERLVPLASFSDLVVTCTSDDLVDEVASAVEDAGFSSVQTITVENRGRDIRPFLLVNSLGHFERHVAVLKVHGKRSTHRGDGASWLTDQLDKLVGSDASTADWLGEVVGGADMVFPSPFVDNACLLTSQSWLLRMAQELQVAEMFPVVRFPAGSIFVASGRFMAVIRELGVDLESFEREDGQLDLTLAHSLERFFGLLASVLATDGSRPARPEI